MAKSREHFALDWIKGELLETLNDAREALEAYVVSDRDETRMRACLTGLHQVHGTLVMLELAGVTLLADHLEQLAQRMLASQVRDEVEASQTLMQGILELPGHIEEIQRGAPDRVQGVLKLVNDVRGHLGEAPLDAPADVTAIAAGAPESALNRFEDIDGIEKARKIRAAYQQVLLSILKGEDLVGSVGMLGKVAQGLQRVCQETPHETLWQAFGEFVQSLTDHSGPLQGSAVKLLRRVDSEIRGLAQHGVDLLKDPVSLELIEQMLDGATERGRQSDTIDRLRSLIKPEEASEGVSISGRQALASAAAALREELLLVKDQLDLLVRSERRPQDDLLSLIAPLKQIGSTLSLLGFESSRAIVADQIDVLNEIADGGEADQRVLLSVAGSLVQVDENLASFTHGGKQEVEKIVGDAERAVTVEARQGLDQVKQNIVDFISSEWDPRHLEPTAANVRAICGALEIIPLTRASRLLGSCGDYIAERLSAGHSPSWEEMDQLADAVSGIDYYLERIGEETTFGVEDVLDLVERSLMGLGVETAAEERAPTTEPELAVVADLVPEAESAPEASADAAISELDAEEEAEPKLAMDDDAGFDLSNEAYTGVAGEAGNVEPAPADDDEAAFELELEPPPAFEEDPSEIEPADEEQLDDIVDPGAADDEPESLIAGIEVSEEEVVGLEAFQTDEVSADRVDDLEVEASPEPADELAVPDEPMESVSVTGPSPGMPRNVPTLVDSFESDAEIVEIFVEEVDEVLETVDEWLPTWTGELTHEESLNEVRRAFHTLKGSGRIVGANVIGELAWSVENMLNRLIDGTVEPTGQFVTVVAEARTLVPALKDAFETRSQPDMIQVGLIMERADVLASGGSLDDAAAGDDQVPTLDAEIDAGAPELIDEAQGADQAGAQQIFLAEARQHLAALEAATEAGSVALTDVSVRALHTLAGSAGMAGIESVEGLARPAYELASTLRSGADVTVSGEVAVFFRHALTALQQTISDLEAGIETDDHAQLVAEADRLILAATTDAEPAAGAGERHALMALDGLSVIMEAHEFLANWRAGAMDMAFGDSLLAALGEVDNVAGEASAGGISELAAAMASALERLADDRLIAQHFEVLSRANAVLLEMFDALAADQSLAPVDKLVAELEGLGVAEELAGAEEEAPAAAPAREQSSERGNVVAFPKETTAEDAPAAATEAPPFATTIDEANDDDDEEPPLQREDISLDDLTEELLGDLGEGPADDLGTERGQAGPKDEIPPADELSLSDELDGPDISSPDFLAEDPVGGDADGDASARPARSVEAQPPQDLLPEELDDEIIEVFFEEADEILESLEENIHHWSSEPGNRLYLEHLLRGLHTLKGGARLSGLTRLGDATHQFESFLIDVQGDGGGLPEDFFPTLHARFDELTGLLAMIRRAVAGEMVVAEPEQETQPAEPAPSVSEPAPVPPVPPVAVVASDDEESAADDSDVEPPRPTGRPERETTAEPRSNQEMVRVGSGLLEDLVNLAGESSIVRARVEQGMSDFTSALEEMETTIERLREQLRRLEIETEAQILFRQDRPEGPAYADFDPLEMDRYSQLQQLSRGLSESASDMLDLKETLLYKARESETLLLQQARINTELQEGLMRTRMVPFSRLLPRLRRIVRQVSTELGKEVEFHAFNAEGELDRSLLERMVPPLEHMLRNAADHGIESSELRKNFGKPAAGRIDLRLSREGGDVVIEISDDGAGIDVESVRAKAVERGLMTEGAGLRDDEITQFVLAPGFSTAKSVTQISGRGVGMDVVHSEVKQLGGSIQIASRPGKGTRFIVRVPFTVSVNRALMVSVGEDFYAIPLNTIEGIVLLSPEELERLYAPDGNTFEYAGIPYRVRYLGHYLGREFRASNQATSVPVVLVRSGDHAVAVHVDSVQGSREIVVKSLGPQFAGVGGISGATILGDGSVVVILDLLALIRAQGGAGLVAGNRTLSGAARTRCVMVVDDSVTVRKVTSRLLERQGMDVIVAKDGVEAVALLQERRPDVMLLDIEMPRMDGFEVARQVRHDDRLADLPIVMISSRTGEKHQEHAAELGVNSFLGKPFQENELLATIDRLVES